MSDHLRSVGSMAWVDDAAHPCAPRSSDQEVPLSAFPEATPPGDSVRAHQDMRIDFDEQWLAVSAPASLELLLTDMTTGGNIIWAAEDYAHLGRGFEASQPITVPSITGPHAGLIRPRVDKSKRRQGDRARTKAEIFTPSWMCNRQNNAIDEAWFGRSSVFNSPTPGGWKTTEGPINFPVVEQRTWRDYVDDLRLEAACGEAPYLVSRYDTTSGELIPLDRRIGLLDRKMRVIAERCCDEGEWLRWARRAFESVYAFEFHGDSLLLARENLLASYIDYSERDIQRRPTEDELAAIAEIIAWNVWQMDALTGTIPFGTRSVGTFEATLFDLAEEAPACRVRDWRANRTLDFRSLMKSKEAR